MEYPLLGQIDSPKDLKKLSVGQLPMLCEEIHSFLIESVSKTGGHLSSNLGIIELTVALHYVFSTPEDKFVFDVGHQCYTHKLLTGRREGFAKLRKLDGLSGFPAPDESEHDAFIAGHGNTALSVAIGMARAKKLKKEPGKVVAIIGDGAMTGGMVYEGMNNIDTLNNLIVILNDNKMSISKNVGSLARHLTILRTSPDYNRAKASTETILSAIPLVGHPIIHLLQSGKMLLRRGIYHSTLFEEMGFQYLGPVDGHDVSNLCGLLRNLKTQVAPVFIHAVTIKGKGFKPAEENPGEFHGVSSFDPAHITDPDVAPAASFSTVFGTHLVGLAQTRPQVCAITAAMKYGTGLQYFYRQYPERFFDVGMAEQHAVTFAAGLASQGITPVVAIYSTFLQRAYDQMIHDVCLMNLNVLFAIDRAGLVPGDGETHQGIYDPAYLRQIGIRTISPCNYNELRYWMEQLIDHAEGPRAIRYSRGAQNSALEEMECSGNLYDSYPAVEGQKSQIALVGYGSHIADLLQAQKSLLEKGIHVDVYKLVQIHPLPEGFCKALAEYHSILFAEECIRAGGIGEAVEASLAEHGWSGRFIHKAVKTGSVVPHATVPEIKAVLGLDAESIAQQVEGELN